MIEKVPLLEVVLSGEAALPRPLLPVVLAVPPGRPLLAHMLSHPRHRQGPQVGTED